MGMFWTYRTDRVSELIDEILKKILIRRRVVESPARAIACTT